MLDFSLQLCDLCRAAPPSRHHRSERADVSPPCQIDVLCPHSASPHGGLTSSRSLSLSNAWLTFLNTLRSRILLQQFAKLKSYPEADRTTFNMSTAMPQSASLSRCHQLSVLLIAMTFILPSFAMACYWDYDTLMQERSRFPIALELITGKFPRHTKEFYEWRVKDRQKKIAATGPTPELLDDLAVAFDKIGDHDQAIKTMELAEQKFPGRYETASNLGTFYFLGNRLEAAIPQIERALQINPDAHFGREKYQLLLGKYVLSKQEDGKTILPLAQFDKDGGIHQDGFRYFIVKDLPYEEQSQEAQRAAKGVLGMMRFANYESPILLEALADLLAEKVQINGNQQLAARAFLQAAYVTADQPELSAKYRVRATHVLQQQMGGSGQNGQMQLSDLEPLFQKELADAKDWYKTLASDEQGWLATSPDPDAAYSVKYASDPEVPDLVPRVWFRNPIERAILLLAVVVTAGLFLATFILVRFLRPVRKR